MKLGLLLLIGLPGSGKTTLAKTIVNNCQKYDENRYHFVHVCYDDLISYKNHSREFEWKSARNGVLQKVQNLVEAIQNKDSKLCPVEFISQFDSIESWDSNIVLLLDDNMYFKSMRYSYFQIARRYNTAFCQVFVCCSLENALSNNSSRGPSSIVPPYIIENMHDKMEPPDCENNWERYSVKLNPLCNLNEICDKLFPILNDSLNNLVQEKVDNSEEKELSKLQCKKSVLHQADIAIRKIIGLKMKKFIDENPNGETNDFVTGLNLRKSEILSDIKTGNISLPDDVLQTITEDVTENYQLINLLGSYF